MCDVLSLYGIHDSGNMEVLHRHMQSLREMQDKTLTVLIADGVAKGDARLHSCNRPAGSVYSIYNKSRALKDLGRARELCVRVLLEISPNGLKYLNQRRPDRRLQICRV